MNYLMLKRLFIINYLFTVSSVTLPLRITIKSSACLCFDMFAFDFWEGLSFCSSPSQETSSVGSWLCLILSDVYLHLVLQKHSICQNDQCFGSWLKELFPLSKIWWPYIDILSSEPPFIFCATLFNFFFFFLQYHVSQTDPCAPWAFNHV